MTDFKTIEPFLVDGYKVVLQDLLGFFVSRQEPTGTLIKAS